MKVCNTSSCMELVSVVGDFCVHLGACDLLSTCAILFSLQLVYVKLVCFKVGMFKASWCI